MAIPAHHTQWINVLVAAARHGDLALMEVREAATGDIVSAICAVGEAPDGQTTFTPLGNLAKTDSPYDAYHPANPAGGFIGDPEPNFDDADWMRPRIIRAFAGYDRTLTGRAAASEIVNRLYEALRQCCKDSGQDPIFEVHAWNPYTNKEGGRADCWGVSWEAGPYTWAYGISYLIMDLTGRLAEPNYSFDLCLYEAE